MSYHRTIRVQNNFAPSLENSCDQYEVYAVAEYDPRRYWPLFGKLCDDFRIGKSISLLPKQTEVTENIAQTLQVVEFGGTIATVPVAEKLSSHVTGPERTLLKMIQHGSCYCCPAPVGLSLVRDAKIEFHDPAHFFTIGTVTVR